MPIVTISASYAAGGSEIAPRVAERLGLRFIDRAVPVSVAKDLEMSTEEADTVARGSSSRLWSLFAGLSAMAGGVDVAGATGQLSTEREFIARNEAHIADQVSRGDCLILGHGAAALLGARADTLHVRLDGDPDLRVTAAMAQHGLDRDAAAAARRDNDKLRAGYVKRFYDVEATDPGLYDMMLDTCRLSWAGVEELIVLAAQQVARDCEPTTTPENDPG